MERVTHGRMGAIWLGDTVVPGPESVDSISTTEWQTGVCRHTATVHGTQSFAGHRGVKAEHLPSGSFQS